MLEAVDRVQLAVHDRASVAVAWRTLLDAAPVREDKLPALAARRTVLAAGRSEIELLEPDGSGPIADFLAASGGPGLFAAGFSTRQPAVLEASLRVAGASVERAGEQLFVSGRELGLPGLNVVVSPAATREPVGLLERLYEVTWLVDDAEASTARFAASFGLSLRAFVPIESSRYGYRGTLTLFHPERLDRVEIIHPYDAGRTMGRFFARRGPSLYMCYAETGRSAELRERALERAPGAWTEPAEPGTRAARHGRPDNLFLHPRALGGVMLGVSRTSFAWSWSGSPQRVDP